MVITKDVFNQTEPFNFYLVTPEGNVLCGLNGIENESASIVLNLQDRCNLSFIVNKYIDIENNGEFILSNGYEYLEKGMEIYIEGIGNFVISNIPEVQFDGYSEQKVINAESCEYELEQKDLVGFYVNTGEVGSQEYLIDENVVTDELSGFKYVKRYIALYDPTNPKYSLLHIVLEQLPQWRIGHVDQSYIDEDGNTKFLTTYYRTENNAKVPYFVKGTFSIDSMSVYAFLRQEVTKMYKVVITFDIVNRLINVYHVSNLGKDSGIYLSSRNYINELDITGQTDEVYTAFNVAGAENLNINYVNFGESQIDNLSYLLKEPFASKELINKYEAFLKYRGTHWDSKQNATIKVTTEDNQSITLTRREYYSLLTRYWAEHQKKADEYYYRVPNDGCSTNWDTFTEEELNEHLDVYIDSVNFILSKYGYANVRDSKGELVKDANGVYKTTLSKDELYKQMYKDNVYYTYIQITEVIIPNIKIALQNIYLTEDNKIEKIDSWETTWEYYGVSELQIKIKTYENRITILTEQGYDKPSTDESDSEDNYLDYYELYKESVKNLKGAKAALVTRQKEYDNEISKQKSVDKQRLDLAESCYLTNKSFGFVDEQGDYNSYGIAILKLRTVTDYVNENYLTTSINDIITTIDVEEELYQAAIKELSSQCRPQYILSTSIDNLLVDDNFSLYYENLILGDYLWLEILDDDVYQGIGTVEKMRIYTMSFNPRIPSDSFKLTFTNLIKSNAKYDDEVFLVESNSGGSSRKNTITAASFSNSDAINAIITPEFLKAIANGFNGNSAFNNAVGSANEYLQAQPNGVLNVTADVINVNKIIGKEGEFEEFFAKHLSADYINSKVVISDVGEFKNLSADVASIKGLLAGTVAADSELVINLSAVNTTIDSAWIASAVAKELAVSDLKAGDIVVSDTLRIRSDDSNFVMNGSVMQFLDGDGNVGIQIGYDNSDTPSMIINDENGTALFTSTGITANAIADELIVNDMIKGGTIDADKLSFTVETDDDGNIITSIENIYTGEGGKFGVEYNTFKESVTGSLGDLETKVNKTIIDVDVVYAIGISNVEAPTTGWTTTAPQWESGKYIWQKTITTYNDKSTDESEPVCIQAAKGDSALTVEVTSSNGNIFKSKNIAATLTARVYYGTTDVTDRVTKFTWSKIDANGEIDTTWNRELASNVINLTEADVDGKASFTCSVEIDI